MRTVSHRFSAVRSLATQSGEPGADGFYAEAERVCRVEGEHHARLVDRELTIINNLFIPSVVIRSFADAETERFWATGRSRRLPPNILKRAMMRLLQLESAGALDDLRMPPSNRLEPLKGDRRGRHSIRINNQWRLCFRFSGGDAFDVEIVDYH